MNYAVIDLGSNSMRLSVYEHSADQIKKIFSRKEIVGLAGYISNGALDKAGIQTACVVINDFKDDAAKIVDVENIHLFATAALRNISNRDEAVNAIAGETGLAPDVLEGDEEAALGLAGVFKFVNCDNGVMIDIGGASTELVLFRDYRIVNLVSLPIGCLNLALDYVKEVIPRAGERKQIKAAIKEQFDKVDWGGGARLPLMVGIGGTLCAASKLSRVLFDIKPEQNEINARHVRAINKMLKTHDGNIYHTVSKYIPERLLTISTGVAILQHVN
jgi:Exopolyphosphatase